VDAVCGFPILSPLDKHTMSDLSLHLGVGSLPFCVIFLPNYMVQKQMEYKWMGKKPSPVFLSKLIVSMVHLSHPTTFWVRLTQEQKKNKTKPLRPFKRLKKNFLLRQTTPKGLMKKGKKKGKN
jgi:hypothetical protein